MTFLPIVSRELTIASRRNVTYWSRAIVALIGIAVGSLVVWSYQEEHPAGLGPGLFKTISVLTIIYCLFVGMMLTADCLSEEKRDGTLGLLFLTDLKGYDIVFGKLAAKSLTAFYGLLAIFPILAFAFPLGGTTADEFWRVCLVAINAMFFSLAMGMLSSAVCRDERQATLMTFGLVFAVTVLAPCFAIYWGNYWFAQWLMYVSPGFACSRAFEMIQSQPPIPYSAIQYWSSSGIVFLLSLVGLLVAMFLVPRSWQEKSTRDTRQLRSFRDLFYRRRFLESNPYFWRAARNWRKPMQVWGLLAVSGLIWYWLRFGRPGLDADMAFMLVAVPLHFIIKIWVTYAGSRFFLQDRQSGAFELLLSTPLIPNDIIRGQFLALRRQFLGPILALLVADWVYVIRSGTDSGMSLFMLGWMVVFVLDLVALGWVSMWCGLVSRYTNRAALTTLWRVIVLPCLIFGIIWIFLTISGTGGEADKKTAVLYLLISYGNSIFFLLRAREKLKEEFSEMATHRFGGKARA